jgi:hypothetical protein
MNDIVKRFQEACKNGNNYAYIEDAGCGMKNVRLNGSVLVQCYPNDEYHKVWVLLHDDEGKEEVTLIGDYTESEQEELFRQYCDVVGYSETEHMRDVAMSEYKETECKVREFCIENSLAFEISCGLREIDFVMGYREEAIDTKTLENPTCIETERHIVVWLPKVGDTPEYEERMHYANVVGGLTAIASPNYIIGAKDGIVKAVMYCVWG